MANATPAPLDVPDPFDLGIHTPADLARGARAALLRNSSAVASSPIGAPPRIGRVTHTPSSPLLHVSNAEATEGAQRHYSPVLPTIQLNQPLSVLSQAHRLEQEKIAAYEAKTTVFRAFVKTFEETLQQFPTGPERHFAEHFTSSFIEFWDQALNDAKTAPFPTYSSIAANNASSPAPPGASPPPRTLQPRHEHQQQQSPRLQGQPIRAAPPREDLRVFARLPADAPARNKNSYAVRTFIAEKLGIEQRKIPRASQVNSGWAIQTSNAATRDLLIERQADWIDGLGATSIEKSQTWFKYIVPNCPRRLTDILGNELDYNEAAKADIACQTGLTPIRIHPTQKDSGDPLTQTLVVCFHEQTKRHWTLFGSSEPARLIRKANPPYQCDTCWDYHPRKPCSRKTRCKRCGETGHRLDQCSEPEKCVNCLGPHSADLLKCPARPKRTHGMLRRLTKEERSLVRRLGRQLYHQQNRNPAQPQTGHEHPVLHTPPEAVQSHEQEPITSSECPEQRQDQPQDQPSLPATATSPAHSFIMVASTPEPDEEPELRAASPKKRRRRATIASP